MPRDDLLLGFIGDDFTGSTDALELLAFAGVSTILYTRPAREVPTGVRAVGIATRARSMPPDAMAAALAPAFAALQSLGVPRVHYKVCSTFDSSPAIGSIGRAIEVGADTLGATIVPVVAGAPSLGRYCVFGNLFARCGSDPLVHRLDRHPSMSRHPVTPMHEADLRLHLAQQTRRPVHHIDVVTLERSREAAVQAMRSSPPGHSVLIDLASDTHLAAVGAMLTDALSDRPAFLVGSSGVESALIARWQETGIVAPPSAAGSTPPADGPVVIICGSCSPVTAGQVAWADDHGFSVASLRVDSLLGDAAATDREIARVTASASDALARGLSVVVHTAGSDARIDPSPMLDRIVGDSLGIILRRLLESARPTPRRVLVAGGDTSGRVAEVLGIESLWFSAPLVRGVPLCRAAAPASPADGIEIAFKGGQMGSPSLFGQLLHGGSS